MIAVAIAGLLCGANVMLWMVLIEAGRATDRAARRRRARRDFERGLLSVESYLSVSRGVSLPRGYGPGAARGLPGGQGGRTVD